MSALISASVVPSSIESGAARLLKVGGVTPFTATDYPGKLSAVVFVQGCPWRCAYCHNPHLQLRTFDSPLSWPRIMGLLEKRIGLIDAVVFSGGEPTIDPALENAMREVRKMGFSVGLHTACIYPKRLASVLPLIDWVGFDIKAPFHRYQSITGVADSGSHARVCAEMIIASGVDHECRTTFHPTLLCESDILELAQTLSQIGVRNYALQIFRPQGCGDSALKSITTSAKPSDDLLRGVSALFPRFTLRQP